MRIDTVQRNNGVNGRGPAGRDQGGAVFNPTGAEAPARAATTAPAAAAASLDYLLALQGVEDPLHGRKKKVIMLARTLLDELEEVKADLLAGQVSPERLNNLMAMVAQARERSEPGLDGLLDDIDLRVRVELAKLGLFPAF
ncbi:MAG: flagellar assembly regulator FliX [Devosia sp.]|uniref:flagellar assembly protein FliX n=1 Tax=Devosia sp. TaxID=1871048 RepID=UPI0026171343|nr:flagellar assembly protein FliX [Devosia sp.]MDB5588643.1 flagellar assembly regulator FliX [Devosia sp.]